jgi:hypothetical protein
MDFSLSENQCIGTRRKNLRGARVVSELDYRVDRRRPNRVRTCCHRRLLPEELYVRVSPHTAQAPQNSCNRAAGSLSVKRTYASPQCSAQSPEGADTISSALMLSSMNSGYDYASEIQAEVSSLSREVMYLVHRGLRNAAGVDRRKAVTVAYIKLSTRVFGDESQFCGSG